MSLFKKYFPNCFNMCDKEYFEEVPLEFVCPLTHDIMKDPYI